MITELTPDQEKLMEVVRDEWLEIGLATAKKLNKHAAKEAILQSYACAGLKVPQFLFYARSPKEGALKVALLKQQNPDASFDIQPYHPSVLTRKVLKLMQMEKLPDDIAKFAQDAFQWACYGQHDAGWLSFYDFFSRIGVEGLEQLDGLKEAARWCGWWWPMENIAVISERPLTLHRDDQGRLHCEDAKAISYNDSWGLYVYHGVNVQDYVIERPETITIDDIMKESNAEIRRIKIERVGEDNFLQRANAELLNESPKYGKLWRVPFENGNDDPWVAVQVINSTAEPDGSRRRFVIPVPPDMQTAEQAVAWTFQMEEGQYNPEQQT